MKVYKLTNDKDQTYNKTRWGENATHETPGTGELCSPGWIHVYKDPLVAVLLNPIHANFKNPHVWIAKASGKEKENRGLKWGFTKVTTLKRVPTPKVNTTQRVAFGIYCALEVCTDKAFVSWARKWLSGEDRSKKAADAAYAAYAAAYAYTVDAAYAAAATYAAATAVAVARNKSIDLKKLAKKAMKVK